MTISLGTKSRGSCGIYERGARRERVRLILNAKVSGITDCGRKNERIILPAVTDLVFDTLHAQREPQSWWNIEWLVMDVTHAFWTRVAR